MKRLLLLCLGACTPDLFTLELVRPDFAPQLAGRELAGTITVRDGGRVVATTSLALSGASASAKLPGLPAERDLEVAVSWSIDGTLVAVSVPERTRLDAGERGTLAFARADYGFPDDDGDGASNLHEAAFGEPGDAADAGAAPLGYFDGMVAAYSLPDFPFSIGAGELGVFGTVYPGTPDVHQLQTINFELRHRVTRRLDCPRYVSDVAVDDNSAAVACGNTIYSVYVPDVTRANAIEATVQLPENVNDVAFGRDGLQLFAVLPAAQTVLSLTVAGFTIIDSIDLSTYVTASFPAVIDDTGELLLVADYSMDGLVAVRHRDGDNLEVEGTYFAGLLPGAREIVYEPVTERLYVNCPTYVILEQHRCPQPAGETDTVTVCDTNATVFPICVRYWASPDGAPAPYTLTLLDFTAER